MQSAFIVLICNCDYCLLILLAVFPHPTYKGEGTRDSSRVCNSCAVVIIFFRYHHYIVVRTCPVEHNLLSASNRSRVRLTRTKTRTRNGPLNSLVSQHLTVQTYSYYYCCCTVL